MLHSLLRISKKSSHINSFFSNRTFSHPRDLAQHLSSSFGIFHSDGDVHVKIRFSSTVARYVEESNWHASQRLTKEKGGSLIAEFDLDGTEEIKRWILSFGQHAEVLEPEKLRKSITKDIQYLISAYSGSGKSASISKTRTK
jgi:predicted DNA-binding transcriptional regulator YafY